MIRFIVRPTKRLKEKIQCQKNKNDKYNNEPVLNHPQVQIRQELSGFNGFFGQSINAAVNYLAVVLGEVTGYQTVNDPI